VGNVTQDVDVIVHGICTTDILFSGLPKLPSLGEETFSRQLGYAVGGSFITAAALARLGVQVGVVCPLGTDRFSEFIRTTMKAESVVALPFETCQSQANVSVCMSQLGDRAIVSYSDELSVADYVAYSVGVLQRTKARMLHISAEQQVGPIIAQAKAAGMYVSMDVGWDESWLRSEAILGIVSKADLFIPNEREACTMTNTETSDEAIRILKAYVSNVVIKCGERGALCWSQRDSCPRVVPAISVPNIVDTTGAGDNFDAGVVYGLLNDMDLHTAAVIGNYCGAASIQGLGGTGNTASLEQVQKYLSLH